MRLLRSYIIIIVIIIIIIKEGNPKLWLFRETYIATVSLFWVQCSVDSSP